LPTTSDVFTLSNFTWHSRRVISTVLSWVIVTPGVLAFIARIVIPFSLSLLPPVRTDATVPKVERSRKFLLDADPTCKALDDYQAVANKILELLNAQVSLAGASKGTA
jgi:hypothetical protein